METIASAVKKCPFCAEIIQLEAIKCKHCGEMLSARPRSSSSTPHQTTIINQLPRQRKWSPVIAALLSFFIPGAGQLYKGDVGTGIAWFIFTAIGYFLLLVPGLILHFCCIITAASGDPYK